MGFFICGFCGEVAERLMAFALRANRRDERLVGSNPTLTAGWVTEWLKVLLC